MRSEHVGANLQCESTLMNQRHNKGNWRILDQMTLLVQTFRELLDSIIQRALGLASSRALNNDVNLIFANAPFRQRRLEPEPLHEVQHCVTGLGGILNVVA